MEQNSNKTITVCSFQPRAVYEEILSTGVYRLTTEDFVKYAEIETSYPHYHKMEKYERLMKKSGLNFRPHTMPIWAWHKEDNGETVSADLYEGALERARKMHLNENDYVEMVGLFLEVSPKEVYLTNFLHWDFYLFSERHDTDLENFDSWTQEEKGWYLADIAEADYYFSKLDEIDGDVKVQAILPEIRKDMIVHVMEEELTKI